MAQKKKTTTKNTKTGPSKSGTGSKSSAKTTVRKDSKRTAARKKSFLKTEIGAIILIAAGVFLLLTDIGLMGSLGDAVRSFQRGLFGQGFWLFGIALSIFAAVSYFERGKYLRGFKLLSVFMSFIALVSLIHLMFAERQADGSAYSYTFSQLYGSGSSGASGGGAVGGTVAGFMQRFIGYSGAYFVLIVVLIISAVIITEKSFVSAARKGAARTAGAVKSGTGAAVEAARAGHEHYAEKREERRQKKEESRRTASEHAGIKASDSFGIDIEGSGSGESEAEAYVRYGREIIGSGQPGIEDLGSVSAPLIRKKYRSALQNGDMNFDTGVIGGLPAEADTVKSPVNIKEINYDDDSVPFEETEEDKYRSYADILNSGVVNAEAAGLAGFAAGHMDDVSEEGIRPEKYESIDAFKNGDEHKVRPRIMIEGMGFEEDSAVSGEDAGAEAEKTYTDDLTVYRSAGDADAATEGGYDDPARQDNGYEKEQTFTSGTGKEMESPDPYEAQRILTEKSGSGTASQAMVKSDAVQGTAADTAGSSLQKADSDKTRTVSQPVKKAPKPKPYVYPRIGLLERGENGSRGDRGEALDNASKLEKVFKEFGVGVTVTNVVRGPRVSRYEVIPDTGVKVSRITALQGDIKLALAATDLRIEAPIPGKSAVGMEVPNTETQTVHFRNILESQAFKGAKSKLSWGIGLDIQGRPVIGDIAKMPHVLVAGTTGSGKSVGINSLIMSILYRSSPDDVRMILIDPKVVELSVYNGIPHLLTEVVTKPDRALSALNWAVAEMQKRYKLFQQSGTRNIAGYNDKVSETLSKLGPDYDGEDKPEKLPFILIVIDELSELMMLSKKDVETAIVSLTQLARAAGIHLVVATQRPSVDVITGLIKSNIPSRIAYRLPSAVDSRTILDQGGAETLLGNGDMLYKPGDKNAPMRVQGAFLSDEEVERVVDYVRKHNSPASDSNTIDEAMNTQMELDLSAISGGDKQANDRDEYFADAGRMIINSQKASIGALQRKFKIGFNRAARIMDQLHEAGVVSDSEGTKERQILMDMASFEELLNNNVSGV